MDELNDQTRKDAYNLLKIFNRNCFQEEFIKYKATEMLTKKIIANVKNLNLELDQIKFLKTEDFKDDLFTLLCRNFSIQALKTLSNNKITSKYKEILTEINTIVFNDMLNEPIPKYENISMIIVAFYDYICNDLDLNI